MRFEHACRGVLGGAVLVASLACAAPALAGPRPKAQYDGRDATHQRGVLDVNRDGSRVAEFAFGTRAPCSDGKRRPLVFVSALNHLAKVRPDGTFSKTLRERKGTASVHGSFDAVGNTVTGSYNIALRARRYTCGTGTVNFVLHRDGTAGAPYRNALVASGLYRAGARGLTLSMRPLLPTGVIHGFRVAYDSTCSTGKHRTWVLRLLLLQLIRDSRFDGPVRDRRRLKSGTTVTTRERVVGAFTYDKGYRVAGVLRARNVIKRPGQRPVVCRASIPFAGRFIRGPLGEEGPHPASSP